MFALKPSRTSTLLCSTLFGGASCFLFMHLTPSFLFLFLFFFCGSQFNSLHTEGSTLCPSLLFPLKGVWFESQGSFGVEAFFRKSHFKEINTETFLALFAGWMWEKWGLPPMWACQRVYACLFFFHTHIQPDQPSASGVIKCDAASGELALLAYVSVIPVRAN